MRLSLAIAVACMALVADPARAAETVTIPHEGAALRGVLFRPQGAGPFPAVVLLHGCSGAYTASDQLRASYRDWGELLSAAGFAVLVPDSFGSRGLGSQCRVSKRKVRASRERIGDAVAARRWLQSQAWVMGDRVALLGFSNGAVTTLWAVRPHAAPHDGKPDFRAAIAFYPGCRRLGNTAWSTRIPTLILAGAKDDWTLAKDCEKMVAGARGRSARVEIHVYPGAYHSFDRLNMPLRLRTGLAYTPDSSGRAHVGSNPAARADAIKRVQAWLAR
jgi:dienelactone hydrolase